MPHQRSYEGKVAIVTGASSGIGQELACQLAAEGADLCLTARRKPQLNSLAVQLSSHTGRIIVHPMDVTEPDACRELIEQCLERLGSIDLLVLNAGISTNAQVHNMDPGVPRTVMDVNYFGAVNPFLHAVRHLEASRGQVIVVSSLAGKWGMPTRAAYCGSKFALHGFFDAARMDLRGSGVDILIACPGLVKTDIRKQALTSSGTPQGQDDESGRMQSVDACVAEILSAARAGKRELLQGGPGPHILDRLRPWAPWLADRLLLRTLSRT